MHRPETSFTPVRRHCLHIDPKAPSLPRPGEPLDKASRNDTWPRCLAPPPLDAWGFTRDVGKLAPRPPPEHQVSDSNACPKCGYPVGDLSVCPECGTAALDFAGIRGAQASRVWWRFALALAAAACISVPLLLPFLRLGISLDASLIITMACFGAASVAGACLGTTFARSAGLRAFAACVGGFLTLLLAGVFWIAAALVLPYP